ncbi:Catalase [Orchesella cincta]|uniref:Catalase n=1 Tax=Orchesella cincta TaxID=48709 RepID=A0A1D2MST1_ORCCI|nr:Catalase [Orchesella cincta]
MGFRKPFIFVILVCLETVFGYTPIEQVPPPPQALPVPGALDPASQQILKWAAQHPASEAGTVRDDQGCSVPSLTASLGIGSRGNLLLEDVFLVNEIAAFNRERIPERVVHAKGHGAFGYFQLTKDISSLTKADFLNGVGKKTRIAMRVSTVRGARGSSDIEREGRGFALKFYTADGIFDLVGNGNGAFPIRDPMLFNDLNRSRKRNPQTNVKDQTSRWDFGSLRPESIMHTLKTFSDHGANSRVIDGFGVHAFKFVNKDGVPVFVKFHWPSLQPFRWFNSTEISLIAGIDPDYSQRDLYNAIANHDYPRWLFQIQVMTVEQALKYPVNPFDTTKVWRPEEFPLMTIGELVFNENPVNQFNDQEQIAFSPERLVPGIEPSNDRMLHARMFSYPDAQRYRLGVNFAQIAVNKPIIPVKNYIRDGFMAAIPNGGGSPNYFPNSFHGPTVNQTVKENVFHVQGIVDRIDPVDDVEDNFRLARLYLYKDLTAEQRRRVASNLGGSLAGAIKEIRERAVRNLFFRITPEFGKQVWDDMQAAVDKNDD